MNLDVSGSAGAFGAVRRQSLHLTRNYGFSNAAAGTRRLFVPQTSKSAVSRVSKPAGGTASWRIRHLDGLPIWKSAIQRVGNLRYGLRKIACKVQAVAAGWRRDIVIIVIV
jgi:hypothetical protein